MPGFVPVGAEPIGSIPGALLPVTQTITLRFASRSFTTRGTDTPPDEFIDGRIAKGSIIWRQLGTVEGGQWGPLIQSRFGEVELVNADGGLDDYVNYYLADGREARIYLGQTQFDTFNREDTQAFSQFQLLYRATAGDWHFEHDIVRLTLGDLGYRLRDKLQFQRYSGGGGIEGTADLAGRGRPIGFGRILNARAQLVDPAILIYQINAGSMQQFDFVYDAGIDVPFNADFSTYAALAASTFPVSPQQAYNTCKSQGFFKLRVAPIGTVTVDFRGSNQGGYVETHGAVIQKILSEFAGFTSMEMDTTSFAALDTAQPGPMGIYFQAGEEATAEDAVARVAFSCGAFVGQDKSGLYRVQRLEAPAGTVTWRFTDRNILSIERERLPYGIPWKAWGVGYAVNWTVQTGTDLAFDVPQARRIFLEAASRYAYLTDANIALAHASSGGAPLRPGLFVNQSDAQQETNRLLSLYGLNRSLYRLTVKGALFAISIGETIQIKYDRWELANGKLFRVVGVEDDTNTLSSTLLAFG